jgi:hypothetical protein
LAVNCQISHFTCVLATLKMLGRQCSGDSSVGIQD